jgi:hypothetical protein
LGALVAEEENGRSFEMRAGLAIAVLAAVLSVNDLYGGKYGDDEIIGTNDKANAYAWYQSKSQKQTLVEHQIQLLSTMKAAGMVGPEGVATVDAELVALTSEMDRLKAEKKEILLGSAAVGEANWHIEDKTGVKGNIPGATVLEGQLELLGAAGDRFDLGTLFLQICLVLGAVALVLEGEGLKRTFFYGMLGMGAVGTAYTGLALGGLWL